MVRALGLDPVIEVPRLDEDAIRLALVAEGATPRDIADALADAKARRIAARHPRGRVLGADQVLDLDGQILAKPVSPDHAEAQLRRMSGRTHRLLSAAVLYEDGVVVWRHVGTARITLRDLTNAQISAHVARWWEDIRGSVGCYRVEAEGLWLISRIEGDHFTILGLPLPELVNYLVLRGDMVT